MCIRDRGKDVGLFRGLGGVAHSALTAQHGRDHLFGLADGGFIRLHDVELLALGGIAPVSYTHLDVYKRQVLENVRVTDKKAAQDDEAVQAAVKAVAEALGDTGRILVRESGTEPLVRVMVLSLIHI